MGYKLMHLHLHGLIRSRDLELGRDADTGGQTLYVLELVKELAACNAVDNVQLVTRLIQDRRVSSDYASEKEVIVPGAEIIRVPFGPKRYLRKELLWPFLNALADKLIAQLNNEPTLPDWIHAHYADAGYVGALISKALGIPLVFTGHSLGREKNRRLLEAGMDHNQIENTYSITRRIEAEEMALSNSSLIITSTSQEAKNQYARYANFVSSKAHVMPPGVDLKRFNLAQNQNDISYIDQLMEPFLRKPELSPLLAISRAVRRKNIPALVEAFGRSKILRERHNLVLVLGTRTDSRQLDKHQREVFQQIFELVDRYELYGQVAYPKKHKRDQIPSFYQWASERKGLFVNPSLTEPFGLTLLEAAACGLPMVATNDGGPVEILARCGNGLLVDVTDLNSLQTTLEKAGSNDYLWNRWKDNGVEGVNNYFSWSAHVAKYIALMKDYLNNHSTQRLQNMIHLSRIKVS